MQDYRQLFTCDKKKNASIQDFRLYKLSEQSKSDNAGNTKRFCNLPHLVITGYILGSLQRLNDNIRPFENWFHEDGHRAVYYVALDGFH